MRYFLTKLTFNNHFDWLYMGNGKFCFFKEKKVLNQIKLETYYQLLPFQSFMAT